MWNQKHWPSHVTCLRATLVPCRPAFHKKLDSFTRHFCLEAEYKRHTRYKKAIQWYRDVTDDGTQDHAEWWKSTTDYLLLVTALPFCKLQLLSNAKVWRHHALRYVQVQDLCCQSTSHVYSMNYRSRSYDTSDSKLIQHIRVVLDLKRYQYCSDVSLKRIVKKYYRPKNFMSQI